MSFYSRILGIRMHMCLCTAHTMGLFREKKLQKFSFQLFEKRGKNNKNVFFHNIFTDCTCIMRDSGRRPYRREHNWIWESNHVLLFRSLLIRGRGILPPLSLIHTHSESNRNWLDFRGLLLRGNITRFPKCWRNARSTSRFSPALQNANFCAKKYENIHRVSSNLCKSCFLGGWKKRK